MQKEHLTMIQQMDTMKQRMQLAEERQKQTVSFLAKVLQNPAFLDHLRQWKEKGEAVSTRIKRKFLKQSKANQSEPASPCEGQIVKYKHTLDGVISSSMNRVMDTSAQELLEEDYFLGGMEDKLGLDENSREFFGTSDETGVRIPAFVDSSDALFKGKYVMSSPMDTSVAAPDFFVTLPEDVSQEEIFLDSMSSETERITLQEGTWNVDFSAVASLLNPGSDIWNDLLGKDAQELDNEAGSSTSWNIGLQEGGEFEIDKLVGDESSYGGCQDQAGLEDSQKNMNS
uniref:Heat stress transcription factor A-3 n=1 Tax=Anthurium amnicola TaxID=1678845 RepID=A0A1D1ZA41_9ARAE